MLKTLVENLVFIAFHLFLVYRNNDKLKKLGMLNWCLKLYLKTYMLNENYTCSGEMLLTTLFTIQSTICFCSNFRLVLYMSR